MGIRRDEIWSTAADSRPCVAGAENCAFLPSFCRHERQERRELPSPAIAPAIGVDTTPHMFCEVFASSRDHRSLHVCCISTRVFCERLSVHFPFPPATQWTLTALLLVVDAATDRDGRGQQTSALAPIGAASSPRCHVRSHCASRIGGLSSGVQDVWRPVQ